MLTSAPHYKHRQEWQKLYVGRWRKFRKAYLQHNPLCRMCEQDGRITQATVVDHIKPHKGDLQLFWDRNNLQPLCKLHHDSTKARQENTGAEQGARIDGTPVDPGHHWNG